MNRSLTGFIRLSLLLATVLATVSAFSATTAPDIRSSAVLVTDSAGTVLYNRGMNEVRPIASIAKLMTAMVILDAGLDLEEMITITRDDRDLIKLTGSRLEFGARLSRGELLQLMLMASENRAASALGRTFPGGTAGLLAAMNGKAANLGMTKSLFRDPAGLDPGNVSTAADLLAMVSAARGYAPIREATTTRVMEVRPYAQRGPLRFGNTNRLLANDQWQVSLSKTGYINEAGRCLVMEARVDDRDLSIILLDSFGRLTPYGDSNRIRRWLQSR